jgi:hypothetical protein
LLPAAPTTTTPGRNRFADRLSEGILGRRNVVEAAQAVIQHLHAVRDRIFGGGDHGGIGCVVIDARRAEYLVASQVGARSHAGDHPERRRDPLAGRTAGNEGPVTSFVHGGPHRLAAGEQMDIIARHDHLAVGELGFPLGESGRRHKGIVDEHGIVDIDPGIDNTDAHAAARALVSAGSVPHALGVLDLRRGIERRLQLAAEIDSFDPRQSAKRAEA